MGIKEIIDELTIAVKKHFDADNIRTVGIDIIDDYNIVIIISSQPNSKYEQYADDFINWDEKEEQGEDPIDFTDDLDDLIENVSSKYDLYPTGCSIDRNDIHRIYFEFDTGERLGIE